jgi:hypothetical protein
VVVSIEPAAPTVIANTQQPFVATVTGAATSAVTWSVQEAGGGDITTTTGVYTAPDTPGIYHVVATSQANSCGTAAVAVTVAQAQPITVTISPAGPIFVGTQGNQTFLATVEGTTNTAVTWSVQGAGGQIDLDGVYGAPASPGVDVITATSVVDPTKFAQVTVNIVVPTSSYSISPEAVTVALGGRVQFSLSELAGGTWSLNGDSTIGTITVGGGLYTAPPQMPTPTSAIRVSHTSVADGAVVTLVSRFLPPETLQVDGCVPQCPADQPNAIVAEDFNDDGLDDLATANSGTGTLSVLIAADKSHFAAPYRLQVGDPNSGDPEALAVADLNQDGTIDLVSADADPSDLAVRARLGVGEGIFGDERRTALPSGSNPLSMGVGHFDSHPQLDVAVANFVTNSVDILRGMGDGTFLVVNTINTGVSSPLSVAVANFNQDAFDDFAVANSGSDTVSVFLSKGDGTFDLQSVQLLASNPSAVAAINLSGSYPDLLVTTTAPSGLTLVLNTREDPDPDPFVPRFLAPDPPIETGSFPVAVSIGNFNRDIVPDVVVANQGDTSVSTYLFDPANDVFVLSETYPVGNLPQALAVGDFNGDGWDDVAVTNSNDDTVSVLRNRGGPTAPAP